MTVFWSSALAKKNKQLVAGLLFPTPLKKNRKKVKSSLLVMDATVGQNALAQVEVFQDVVDITGLVMTKLDGTAKGGVVVALAEKFALPVVAVGVGEGIDDMRAFEAQAFARSLMSLEN